MNHLVLFALISVSFSAASAPPEDSHSNGIHLNIEYPKDDQNGRLNVATGDAAEPSDIKTPVVIIAPKPLLDYERLYKKMMHSPPRENGHEGVERNMLYDKKVAYSDPVSRRQLLFELLRDAEADLAFYRADHSEMELVARNYWSMSFALPLLLLYVLWGKPFVNV
ncbi:fumarate reductase, putative [Babesia ovis]|uniref:Fumarate reductase, putative n=1 Tax=Babesia ovis TaxID=5869 RepID=A0A9W5WWA5_BABOV|nr:fumarate reductase, putative [Babesia ovis]